MSKTHRKQYEMFSILLMLIALNISAGFATIGVYNFGYILTGELIGCTSGRAVIYEGMNKAYSEIWCPAGLIYKFLIFLGGVLSVFSFGLLFFLVQRFPLRFLSYVIWGLGLYLNYKNLSVFDVHPLIQWAVAFAGVVLIFYGEDRFITEEIKS